MSRYDNDFAWALRMLKDGHGYKLRRAGWADGAFVVLQKGYPDGIPINKNTAEATGMLEGTTCRFLPYLMLKTATRDFVPWLPNMVDILANDWELAE